MLSLGIDPEHVTALGNKALLNLKKFEEAIRCCDKALEIDPKNLAALLFKGLAFEVLKRYDEAIRCCDKALEIYPNATIWNSKGRLLYQLGMYSEAIGCYNKASEIDSGTTVELDKEKLREN